MTVVACKCGKTAIELLEARPRFTAQCCCTDCFYRAQAFAERSKVPLPAAMAMRTRGTDAVYFGAALRLVRCGGGAGAGLRRSMLHCDGMATHLGAPCCGSCLLVDHPSYAGRCVAAFRGAVKFEPRNGAAVLRAALEDAPPPLPSSALRWMTCDLTAQQRAALEPLEPSAEEEDEAFERFCVAMQAGVSAELLRAPGAATFAELCAERPAGGDATSSPALEFLFESPRRADGAWIRIRSSVLRPRGTRGSGYGVQG